MDLPRARQALHVLKQRGPDQWGDWNDSNIYIGHHRLSIIDLSEAGRQPMVEGVVSVAVNGEIYNFKELRKQLIKTHEFRSDSDSEVILHGYQEWGVDELLRRVDGMYAIAIYDSKKRSLFIVRDRFGKKPLYYAHINGRILFASEIKALLEFEDDLRVFSRDGIRRWIYHRGSHTPLTIFHNVMKVKPGSYLEISDDKIRETKYYDVMDDLCDCKQEDSENGSIIEGFLDQSVSKRLVADVPVGLQLSGGVDSSLIGHFMHRHHQDEMHSFSVGFAEEEYQHYSEERYARYVASREGFTHHQFNIKASDFSDAYERSIYLFDGMLDYPNAIPIHLLSSYAKQYVTVVLTGEGADEIFGGYSKFRRMESLQRGQSWAHSVPDTMIRGLGRTRLRRWGRALYLSKKYGGHPQAILENLNCYISPSTFKAIFGERDFSLFDDISFDRVGDLPFFRQALVMDHKTYLSSLLDRQDRASMGAAIESRLPFLDQNLISNAVSLPKASLFDSRENKRILKTMCAKIYGDEFTYRPKKGFPMPLTDWLDRNQFFLRHIERIFDEDSLLGDIVDLDALSEYLDNQTFDRLLLNYGDSDRIWVKWFLMTIRTAQDVFRISAVR